MQINNKEEDTLIEQSIEDKVQEIPLIDYEFGDLCIECSCGHIETFVPGIEGIQLPVLAATNKHELVLVCAKCGHRLRLFFQESQNKEELRKQKEEFQAFKQRAEEEAATNKIQEEENGSGIIE